MSGPFVARLPDGHRLHLQHGPMDLVVAVDAPPALRTLAEQSAIDRFTTILDELVGELPHLRAPVNGTEQVDEYVQGSVARRMVAAAVTFADVHVTPMVAVAGSIAEEVVATIAAFEGVRRASVNNGGDLAVHVEPGQVVMVGLVADLTDPTIVQRVALSGDGQSRGMATSGWGGRSFSLGVADAVTVVAARTSVADAAATLIANAVDVDHPCIQRSPARKLDPDSDLGDLLVTVDVGHLPDAAVQSALEAGAARATQLMARTPDLHGVSLALQGRRCVLGTLVQPVEPTEQTDTSSRPGGVHTHRSAARFRAVASVS